MQDLNDKVTTDSLTASEWNQMPSELQNIIEDSGQTLSGADLDQVGKGVAAYVGIGDFYVSSGPADAYVLTPLSPFQGPTSYFNGMRVRFIPNVANTGAAVTVNVNGLGVRTVVREDGLGNSSNTEYQTTVMVELRYDSGAGNFKLRRIRNAGTAINEYGLSRIATQTEVNSGVESSKYVTSATLQGRTATETRDGIIEIATQTETNTGSDDTRAVTPLKLATRLGLLGTDDIGNDSTIPGADLTEVLDNLGSDDVANDSGVTGTTVTDALDNLNAAVGALVTTRFKTSDQNNSSSVGTNVAFLTAFSASANTDYIVEGFFVFDNCDTEGITCNVTGPTGSVVGVVMSYNITGGGGALSYQSEIFGGPGSGTSAGITLAAGTFTFGSGGVVVVNCKARVSLAGTAGNINFVFGKATNGANPVISKAGSWATITPA